MVPSLRQACPDHVLLVREVEGDGEHERPLGPQTAEELVESAAIVWDVLEDVEGQDVVERAVREGEAGDVLAAEVLGVHLPSGVPSLRYSLPIVRGKALRSPGTSRWIAP